MIPDIAWLLAAIAFCLVVAICIALKRELRSKPLTDDNPRRMG